MGDKIIVGRRNGLRLLLERVFPLPLFCVCGTNRLVLFQNSLHFLVQILAQFWLSHHSVLFYFETGSLVGFVVSELTLEFFAVRQKTSSCSLTHKQKTKTSCAEFSSILSRPRYAALPVSSYRPLTAVVCWLGLQGKRAVCWTSGLVSPPTCVPPP